MTTTSVSLKGDNRIHPMAPGPDPAHDHPGIALYSPDCVTAVYLHFHDHAALLKLREVCDRLIAERELVAPGETL